MKIGNDIVRVSRMKDIYTNKRLMDRIFTSEEQAYFEDANDDSLKYERMAGKIAIKEAVAKAFGVGIAKELSWLDIQTSHDKNHKPIVLCTSKIKVLLKTYNLAAIDVSVSHMDDYATAVCIVYN